MKQKKVCNCVCMLVCELYKIMADGWSSYTKKVVMRIVAVLGSACHRARTQWIAEWIKWKGETLCKLKCFINTGSIAL